MRQKRMVGDRSGLARNIPSRVQHPCAMDTAGRLMASFFMQKSIFSTSPWCWWSTPIKIQPAIHLVPSWSDLMMAQSEIPGLGDSIIATSLDWTILMRKFFYKYLFRHFKPDCFPLKSHRSSSTRLAYMSKRVNALGGIATIQIKRRTFTDP